MDTDEMSLDEARNLSYELGWAGPLSPLSGNGGCVGNARVRFAQVQPLCHADEGTEVNGQRVHWPVSLSVVPLVRTTLGQSIASPRFARNERR